MKVLIIEDEKIASDRLEKMIKKVSPEITVIDKLETVRQSIQWFKSKPAPDLVFLDIQLADGISFDIFQKVNVNSPVIFTTSYDRYALKAFELNSIDYLLKPLKEEDLRKAIEKFNNVRQVYSNTRNSIDNNLIRKLSSAINKYQYKDRFVVKIGDHIKTFSSGDILYFESNHKITYVHVNNGKKYIIDYTLDQLVDILDPSTFFRINRKYIISLDSYDDIVAWTNSRLRICLKGNTTMDAVVAREKVTEFKKWLEGEF